MLVVFYFTFCGLLLLSYCHKCLPGTVYSPWKSGQYCDK